MASLQKEVLLRCIHCEDRLEFYEENSTSTNPNQTFKLENGSAQQSPSLEYCIMNRNQSIYSPRRIP